MSDPGSTIVNLAPAKKSKIGVTKYHLQCPNCGGLFRHLGCHKCPAKKKTSSTNNVVTNVRSQVRCLDVEKSVVPSINVTSTLISIIAQLRDGPVKRVIYEDKLLLLWADFEVRKHLPNVDSSSTEDEKESPEIWIV